MEGKKTKQHSGRNVINIEGLRDAIKLYAAKKQLPDTISHWLTHTLVRWTVNYFPHYQVVKNSKHFTALTGKKPPKWYVSKQNNEFIFIDIQHPRFDEVLERTSEWLGANQSSLADKFHKMTVPQVLKKWSDDHERMKRQKLRHIDTSGKALKVVFNHGDMYVVELLKSHEELHLEMANESAQMQHCLGEFDDIPNGKGGYGEYYLSQIQENSIRLFSVRDSNDKSHVTISIDVYSDEEEETLSVDQIKGKQNTHPIERYVPICQAFLNHLNVSHDYDEDCLNMGLVYHEDKTKNITELDDDAVIQQLLAYNPALITKVKAPTKQQLWLSTMRKPDLLAELKGKGATEAMKIAALLQSPRLMHRLDFETKGFKSKSLLQGKSRYCVGDVPVQFIKLQPKRI